MNVVPRLQTDRSSKKRWNYPKYPKREKIPTKKSITIWKFILDIIFSSMTLVFEDNYKL
jgi:hypothetical protein